MQGPQFDFVVCGEGLDWPTRLTGLYLFFCIAGLIAVVIKNWTIIGLQSNASYRKLIRFDQLWNQRDWPRLRALAQQFRSSSPEAGLRTLNTNIEAPPRASFFEQADLHFKTKAEHFDWSLKNISRCREATLLILAAYTGTELSYVLQKIAIEKSAGLGVIGGGLSEIAFVLSIGFWFLVSLFLCQWHFTARIRKRKAFWNGFITGVKTNLSLEGKHEQ